VRNVKSVLSKRNMCMNLESLLSALVNATVKEVVPVLVQKTKRIWQSSRHTIRTRRRRRNFRTGSTSWLTRPRIRKAESIMLSLIHSAEQVVFRLALLLLFSYEVGRLLWKLFNS
jgi:hypothetical protein